ncbi:MULTISPECIES: class I SAM-dependent methyltransferase [unclassified Psychrobacter]|uniref:class I SAM-dependent DNA methyltransferase n=1 Tax=unclassified Psychrobacter TaxID=196806 RepID=UPI0025CC483F|nr:MULTISPECIES: class I SAM-dependent methyltransferase [unclassified Psychrobacter]
MSYNLNTMPTMNNASKLRIAKTDLRTSKADLHLSKNQTAHDSSTDKSSDTHSANTYSESYFDALYNDNSDPWQYQTRWYEKRKRDMCLAVLPQAKYANAIELGCGNGVFSELLARRCQAMLSIDGNHQAVQLAKRRLAESTHVKVIQGVIPDVLTTNKSSFDLVIISEILYYLSTNDIDTVIAWIKQNLAVGGTLLCCHWRYAIDGFAMTGETVHQRLHQAFNKVNNDANPEQEQHINTRHSTFTHQSKIIDSDFLLDVWQHTSESVAMQENLV